MFKILVVDDQPVFAGGLKTLLLKKNICGYADIELADGEFTNVPAGQAYDLALIAVSYYVKELVDLLVNINPKIGILLIAENETNIDHVIYQGAHGFILRNFSEKKVLKTINDVLGSQRNKVKRNFHRSVRVNLSTREKELLNFICEGYTNVEIAGKLCLGEETIKSYRKNLLAKLNARNTAVLVRIAIEQDLL